MARALLLLFLFTAIVSTVSHAKTAAPAPAVSHHQSHHQDQNAPCCDAGTCVGCAVLPANFVSPARVEPLPFRAQPAARLIAVVGPDAHPDLPPPRS